MISKHPAPRSRAGVGPVIVLSCLLAACASPHPGMHESTNATLWSLTAAEYAAGTTQAYHSAIASLDQALENPLWTAALEQRSDYAHLPAAVLVDIDQTVLDNSIYNARIVTQLGEYSQETFSQWCKEEAATAIPGARAFTDYAVQRGVTVIYVSRRIEPLRDCTTNNLRALGFPVAQKHLLLNDTTPQTRKNHLRRMLSSEFRILLLIGDDLDDFVDGSRADPRVRRELVQEHEQRWGNQWIVLPNPMHGGWETTLHGHNYDLDRREQLHRKLKQLEH